MAYALPALQCAITDHRLSEISGMVTGASGPYVINDKAPAVVYALDWRCRVKGQFRLGVAVRDTEDLARTPNGTLVIGDIGGNRFVRRSVVVHRLGPRGGVSSLRLRYPDGPHDAEAMLVSPAGVLVIITKRRDGRSGIYTAPLWAPGSARLRRVGTLAVGSIRSGAWDSLQVTGGAVAAGGKHFALRTYTTAYEWDTADGDLVKALRSGRPRAIRLPRSRQGEALSYSIDGRYLMASGEKLPAPLHLIRINRG